MNYTTYLPRFMIVVLVSLLLMQSVQAAPRQDLLPEWVAFNPRSTAVISYPVWQGFLAKYLVLDQEQAYINYKQVSKADHLALHQAISSLSQLPIDQYNRAEQLAYWLNLYNMATVDLVLESYPINSIRDIGSGLFSYGPWDKELLTVDGQALSLNDIEHGIIRPIWHDPRIHAAVNCASIGCPNLAQQVFAGTEIQQQLDQVFSQFVNSNKGLIKRADQFYLSKIFAWYGSDFGSAQQLRNFIASYITDVKLAQQLRNTDLPLAYQTYDWRLNAYEP